MTLAFFEEQLNNVHVQLRGLGQPDAIGCWCAWDRFPDAEHRSVANRHNVSNEGCFPVEDGDALSPRTMRKYS